MNAPKIEIKGHAATGKSSLAWAIKDVLDAHGIKCEVTGCEDETPGAMDDSWRQRIKGLAGKTVTVETVQLDSPADVDSYCPNGQVMYGTQGMSLRDHFAGLAMQGLVRDTDSNERVAEWAYQQADAMIAERSRIKKMTEEHLTALQNVLNKIGGAR